MINQHMYDLGAEPNKIRELFMYGLGRKEALGADKVFDYSIGNPSVPAPDIVGQTFKRLLDNDPVTVHEYTPSPGDKHVREVVAAHISEKFNTHASASNVYMTSGASSAIAITIAAITNPGDEVIAITPYFPEYKTWTEAQGCKLVEVPAKANDFQLDIEAIGTAINPKTSAIIINSPNNPTGAVYPRKALEELAGMLRQKEDELGHSIYIISDEPYREIVYGAEVAYVPEIYTDTIICYTWSKSLSLPGERIGYIYVNDAIDDAAVISVAVQGAGRALGYICAPVLLQRVVAECIDVPADVAEYAKNREILCKIIKDIGYEYVEPEGAFYLWMRALEPDAIAFSERAKDFELLIVPSNSFGTTGWVRLSYCIAEETIRASKPALQALWDSYNR